MRSADEINAEIYTLREELHSLIENRETFHNRKIVALSTALDDKIVEYMSLSTQEQDE